MTNFFPPFQSVVKGLKMLNSLYVSTTAAPTACQNVPTPPNGCNAENNGCCKPSNQCLEGQGDCDYNDDCLGNLRCGDDNCDKKLGFSSSSDCCYDPNRK